MKKPSTIKIIVLALTSVVLIASITFAAYYYVNYSVNAGNKEVIDFKDMNKDEIEQYLIDNSIKSEYVIFEEEYSEEVEEGKVISQSILAGEGKFKDTLTIVISKGFDPDLEVELPDITDLMQTDIMDWFEENHFTNIIYQFIVPEDSETEIPYGKVIGISKLGLAKRSEEITVTLADETSEETTGENENQEDETSYVEIVDFSNYTLDQFVDWVKANGLKYYVYEVYSDEYAKGKVMSQSPKAGAKAKKGSTVTLRMSLGKAKKLENLVGKTEADAKTYCTDNNLKLKTVEEYSRTVEKGKIIKTSPGSGSTITDGDTITITISKGSDIIELGGSYVGKTEAELKKAVTAKYSSAKFATPSMSYSDSVASGSVISHDSNISVVESFKYTLSLGSYSDSNHYVGQTLNDVQSVVNTANSKGAGVTLTSTNETTTDSTKNNKIKNCDFANKKYTCVVYQYKEASSTFVASDFANKSAGAQTYSKDGNTYNITVNITYTDYNDQTADSFNSATCSTGNVIKNGSVVTVVKNKGPRPVTYGTEIVGLTYKSCQITDDTATYDAVVSRVKNVLINSYGYQENQISIIPTDNFLVGQIDIDRSSKGTFVVGADTITVYVGTAARNQ